LDQEGWEPTTFVRGIFGVIISSGSWAQQYILALELIKHARDAKEKRKIILSTVSHVIALQTRKAATIPRALETLSSLLTLVCFYLK
jgi:hypothetical protein